MIEIRSPGAPTTRLMNVWVDSPAVGTSHAAGWASPSAFEPQTGVAGSAPAGGVEHHDVADARRGVEPVGQHSLADVEGGKHRQARDPVGLDHEGLDHDRESDSHGNGDHELDQRLDTRFR